MNSDLLDMSTILCSPAIYKKTIQSNVLNLSNSFDEKFELEQPAYKRGNFHSNNVALQRIFGMIYGIDIDKFPGHVALTSSCTSIGVLFSMIHAFNHILYDKINPEMIQAFSIAGNASKFNSISQIQTGDLICIESCQFPECIDNRKKIQMISDYAHSKQAFVLVDNSCLTGINWNPFLANVDFCIESLAKNSSGFNNAILGLLAINPKAKICNDILVNLFDSIRFFGFYPNPIDCYMVQLGAQTMSLRLERIKSTTKKIVLELNKYNNIKFNYSIDSGLIFIEHEKIDIDKFNCLKIIQPGAVFGANYTILDIMENTKYIRISIGLEKFEDLMDDIKMIINIVQAKQIV